jgi:peptidoglycan hydrolase CwlO-like protein
MNRKEILIKLNEISNKISHVQGEVDDLLLTPIEDVDEAINGKPLEAIGTPKKGISSEIDDVMDEIDELSDEIGNGEETNDKEAK